MPIVAIIILISIFVFSGALCPDNNGYLLKYQAQRFKVGAGTASFYDETIKYAKNVEFDIEKTFAEQNVNKLKF